MPVSWPYQASVQAKARRQVAEWEKKAYYKSGASESHLLISFPFSWRQESDTEVTEITFQGPSKLSHMFILGQVVSRERSGQWD